MGIIQHYGGIRVSGDLLKRYGNILARKCRSGIPLHDSYLPHRAGGSPTVCTKRPQAISDTIFPWPHSSPHSAKALKKGKKKTLEKSDKRPESVYPLAVPPDDESHMVPQTEYQDPVSHREVGF
jgi:hypothetical protein